MRLLADLSLLYLTIAQSGDERLSNAELEAVTANLHKHFSHFDHTEVQTIVLEALTTHLDAPSLHAAALEVVEHLGEGLTDEQKDAVLKDLYRIARADGVILDVERELLASVAAYWGVDEPDRMDDASAGTTAMEPEDTDDALVHLAFIYLVLAHGTDRDFSAEERQMLLKRLQEWRPTLIQDQVEYMLDRAMNRYAQGITPDMLSESVEAVRVALPDARRKAALNDLIQIANADGVFLDSEEDLINDLVDAWGLPPYASYGDHGTKE